MYGVVYVAYTNGQMGFMRTTCGIFSSQCRVRASLCLFVGKMLVCRSKKLITGLFLQCLKCVLGLSIFLLFLYLSATFLRFHPIPVIQNHICT